jgi:hypothetical protein
VIKAIPSPIEIVEVTDATEVAAAKLQRSQFDRNSQALQQRIGEVYSRHRGMHVCVAGEELYVAETAKEAVRLARAAHPEDMGWFTRSVPIEKVSRIYAF